jgi:hypothetical protein
MSIENLAELSSDSGTILLPADKPQYRAKAASALRELARIVLPDSRYYVAAINCLAEVTCLEKQEKDATKRVRPSPELEKRFRSLAKRWRKETEHLSSTARMAKHPAYQEIISLGESAIPLLLAELERRPDFWFEALRAITRDNPVPPESTGNVKEMAKLWIAWGRARGYCS